MEYLGVMEVPATDCSLSFHSDESHKLPIKRIHRRDDPNRELLVVGA